MNAVVSGPGAAIVATDADAERFEMLESTSTIALRAARPEVSLLELAVEPAWSGVGLHHQDDHADSFFVREGEAVFLPEGKTVRVEPGTLVSADRRRARDRSRRRAGAIPQPAQPDGGFAESVRTRARRRAG